MENMDEKQVPDNTPIWAYTHITDTSDRIIVQKPVQGIITHRKKIRMFIPYKKDGSPDKHAPIPAHMLLYARKKQDAVFLYNQIILSKIKHCGQIAKKYKKDMVPETEPDRMHDDFTYQKLLRTAWEKHRLYWMITHGHTLTEMMSILQDIWNENDPSCLEKTETPVTDTFCHWENDNGFGSEIWPSEKEFETCEFQDQDYMLTILTDEEFALWRQLHR